MKNPEVDHHVRGLVRLLDEEINAVRRELKNLQEAGILVSEPMGNRVVYRINKYCPIIPELTSLFRKDTDTAKQILRVCKMFPEVTIAILTSNFIQNKYDNDYDLDVLFVGEPDMQAFANEMLIVERELRRQMRYTVMPSADFDFRKKKRDTFLVNILKNDRIVLLGNDKDLSV
jgi:hypothetical protein